jgi:hypothetical protein
MAEAAVSPATAMKGLAVFRIVLGAASWIAPRQVSRAFGVSESRITPELEYMTRVFGVRAVTLGVGYLASSGDGRALWHRLWLLCDTADTAMGAAMVRRGELEGLSAAAALTTTGGAATIDLAGFLGD